MYKLPLLLAVSWLSCLALTRPALGEPNSQGPEETKPPRERTTLTTHLYSPFFGVYYLEANTRLCERLALLTSWAF